MDFEIDILTGTVEIKEKEKAAAAAAAGAAAVAEPVGAPEPVSSAPSPAASAGGMSVDLPAGLLGDIPDLILPDLGAKTAASAADLPPVVAEPAPVARSAPPAPESPVFSPAAPAPVQMSAPAPVESAASRPIESSPFPPMPHVSASAPAPVAERVLPPSGLIQEIQDRWEKIRVVHDEVTGAFHLKGTLAEQYDALQQSLRAIAKAPREDAERATRELARLTGLTPLWIWAEAMRLR